MDNQEPQDSDSFAVPVNVVAAPQNQQDEYVQPDHQIPEHTSPDSEISNTPTEPENYKPETFNFPETEANLKTVEEPESVTDRAALASSLYPSLEPTVPKTNESPVKIEPLTAPTLSMPMDDRPVPVVKVLSVRGVEYAMMSILLWFGAGSLTIILVSLINGMSGFEALAFPLAVLLVCLPGFAFLFLRLRAAELANPELRLEASKRRFSQITQIIAFLTCFFNFVAVVYLFISMAGGTEIDSIGKVLGSAGVILVIAGGILYYYWIDEHRLVGRK
jgi:hypothetical protein